MPRKGQAKKRAKSQPRQPEPVPDGLNGAQRVFALAYLGNGFNASAAYREAHAGVTDGTARTEGSRTLALPNLRAFLSSRLEAAWKPYQMGGEQALGRVAVLAAGAPDDRVKLAALRTILEQTGKLKNLPDSIDALAAALRADLEAHK